jgi:hypothetical protein
MQSAITASIALAYYGGGTSYASYVFSGGIYPFTAGHDALQLLSESEPEIGDLMVDVLLVAAPSINDCITQMTTSTFANQKGIIGVYTGTNGANFVPASLGEYTEAPDGTMTLFQLKPEFQDIFEEAQSRGIDNRVDKIKYNEPLLKKGGDADFIYGLKEYNKIPNIKNIKRIYLESVKIYDPSHTEVEKYVYANINHTMNNNHYFYHNHSDKELLLYDEGEKCYKNASKNHYIEIDTKSIFQQNYLQINKII